MFGREGFSHSQFFHVANGSLVHIQSHFCLSRSMLGSQLRYQFGRIVSSIVRHNGRNLSQRPGKGFHGQCLFTGSFGRRLVNGRRHGNFATSTSVHGPGFLDGTNQNRQSIVQTSFGFFQHVRRRSPENNTTRFARLTTTKSQHLVFTNHDLFNDIALSQRDRLGSIKRTHHISPQHGRQAFDAIKIGVFNRHDTGRGKHAFGQVVN
mmetsp:Transcript_20577/g.56808  ORF Transcript_20577/g.56808 Transcript_20577/m.56808 type:complete len:207 (-) Transcript_20577:1024-1644(-)